LSRRTTLIAMLVALTAAGSLRALTDVARDRVAPDRLTRERPATAELARLDSAALGLLLGGLRGPLVMALWTDAEAQRGQGLAGEDLLGGLDTKIELIRLLQPQFDSVHLQQIHNKAYNISAELVDPAAKYAAILDAIDYGRRVLADRPDNIDIETQLGQVYARKLGSAAERVYAEPRVRDETDAARPRARLTFDAARVDAITDAAARAGVSPRELVIRSADRPDRRSVIVDGEVADAIADDPGAPAVTAEPLTGVRRSGVGQLDRLEPMLDEAGRFLPELTRPTRDVPAEQEARVLDGSRIQFLDAFEPFPEGVGPHALAYEHFRRAYVLGEHAGQRHVQASAETIQANPGRALRDWALAAYELGRQLEAEALGREAPPRSVVGLEQAQLELRSADLPLDAPVPFEALLRRAINYYERAREVGLAGEAWLSAHIEEHPDARFLFVDDADRLGLNARILEADLAFARLALRGDVPDAAARAARELYREADVEALDYALRYYLDPRVVPAGVSADDVLGLPLGERRAIYANLQALRDRFRGTGRFDGERAIDEFDGIRLRIARRIPALDRQLADR